MQLTKYKSTGFRAKSDIGKIRGADLVAAISIAGILIPEAIAYAGIANLPPQAGIIALFAGLICYGLFGASRFAIVSATSSSAMMVAAVTASIAGDDMSARLGVAAGLVLFVGAFFVFASWAKLGAITDFIAKPVLRGFAFGLALIIVVKQIASIAGVHLPEGNFLAGCWGLIIHFKQWNIFGTIIAGLSLLVIISLSRFKKIPGGFVVIVLGIIAGILFDLPAKGVDLVGSIDLALEMPSFPALTRVQWMNVAELGLTLSLILYSESYGSIKNYAVKHSDQVYPNKDLFALGISNLVSGLFSGMPVGAGYSATAANEAAGARSRWAGLVSAMIMFVVIVVFLPLIAYIPMPVLAAIVIYAVSHTLNIEVFKPYFRWKKDRLEIVVSIVSVLLFGIVNGLIVAIVISLIMLLKRFSESNLAVLGRLGDSHDFVKLTRYPDARPIPGMMIFRPDQPMFFANCEKILNQIRGYVLDAGDDISCIIVSMEESPDIDSTTIESFDALFGFTAAQGKHLIMTRLKGRTFEALSDIASKYPNDVELNFLSVDDAVKLCNKYHQAQKTALAHN